MKTNYTSPKKSWIGKILRKPDRIRWLESVLRSRQTLDQEYREAVLRSNPDTVDWVLRNTGTSEKKYSVLF